MGAPETLSPGERIAHRLPIGAHEFVLALSIDDARRGHAALPGDRAQPGASAAQGPIGSTHYLPDSVEFTGKGSERLIVMLSDQPLEVEAAKQAAHAAFSSARATI